jgi:hypothetical protein
MGAAARKIVSLNEYREETSFGSGSGGPPSIEVDALVHASGAYVLIQNRPGETYTYRANELPCGTWHSHTQALKDLQAKVVACSEYVQIYLEDWMPLKGPPDLVRETIELMGLDPTKLIGGDDVREQE